MQKINYFRLLSFFVFSFLSCTTSYQTQAVNYKDYRITKATENDAQLTNLIKPYADSVNKSMNNVIAVAEVTLEKKQPEGALGNLMADIMLTDAKQKYKTNVDGSVMNYGGIRLPAIAAGNITKGKVFELSPFDNIVVLQKLTGTVLQSLLDHIASKNGWPVAGISFQIKNRKAVNVKINNLPIDLHATYTIAILDYVANGGDDATMLRSIPQINNGYLFRDGILEYLSAQNNMGKKISAKIENRISYAE